MEDKMKVHGDGSKAVSRDDMEKAAKNLRGLAKAALTRITNFINSDNQIFDKHDWLNKIQKIEAVYTEFDRADADLPVEMSEMEEFEKKYYGTKAKLQQELEKLNFDVTMQSNSNSNNIRI